MLNRIDQSLQALSTMFDTLLDLSRLDAGLVPQRGRRCALTTLLLGLVDEHEPAAHAIRACGCRRRSAARRAPPSSDAGVLETCLRNLIVNALKYTERGVSCCR